jgi:hypothetical protein
MKEREARGASLFFHLISEGRISRVKTAPARDGRWLGRRMNARPWFGSAVPACAIHSFLGGGDEQPVELLADEDRTTPAASPGARMDGPAGSGAKRSFARSRSKPRPRSDFGFVVRQSWISCQPSSLPNQSDLDRPPTWRRLALRRFQLPCRNRRIQDGWPAARQTRQPCFLDFPR